MDPFSQLQSFADDMHHNQQNIIGMYPVIDSNFSEFLNGSDQVVYLVLNRLKSIVHKQQLSIIHKYLSIQIENKPHYLMNKLRQLHAECVFYLYQTQPIEWQSIHFECILYLVEQYHDMFERNDLIVLNQLVLMHFQHNIEQSLSCLQICHFYELPLDYSTILPCLQDYPIHLVDIFQYQSESLQLALLNQILNLNLNHRDIIYAFRYLKSAISIQHIPLVLHLSFDFDDLQDMLSIIQHCSKFEIPISFIQSVVYKSFELLIENDEDDPNTDDLLSENVNGILINLSLILAQFPVGEFQCSDDQFIYYHWCCMYHISQQTNQEQLPLLHPQAKHILTTNVCDFESLFLASHIWHSFTLLRSHPVELLEIAVHYISDYLTELQIMHSILTVILNTTNNVDFILNKLYKSILIVTRRVNQSNLIIIGQILDKIFSRNPLKLKSLCYINISHLHILDIFQGVLMMQNEDTYDIILKYVSNVPNEPFLILKSLEIVSMINTDTAMDLMHHLFNKYKSEINGVFIAKEMSFDHLEDGITCMAKILGNLNRRAATQEKARMLINDVYYALRGLDESYIMEIDVLKGLLVSFNENLEYALNPDYFEFLSKYCVYEEMQRGIRCIVSWAIINNAHLPVVELICEMVFHEFVENGKFIELIPLLCHIQPQLVPNIDIELELEVDVINCKNYATIKRHLQYLRLKMVK